MDDIKKAWVVVGKNPQYHHEQQERLRKEWPTLYKAIIKHLSQ